MPNHQIPNIIFGVQNRVSYKSRQLKNSTLSTNNNIVSGIQLTASLYEDKENPDWEVTMDYDEPLKIYTRSSTYKEGYYIELLDSKNPLIGGTTQWVMKETI